MTVEQKILPAATEITRYGPDGSRLTIEHIGVNPAVFFVSGIHGDEGEIIAPLRRLLDEKAQLDPGNFGAQVRVLEANPLALEQGTRTVKNTDLNRQFIFKSIPDNPQAKLIAEALLEHKEAHALFSFHEDPLENRFYFYNLVTRDDDGSQNPLIQTLRDNLMSKISSMNIALYNGIDDIELGYWVDRGFCAVAADAMHDNSFEMWAVQKELHDHPNMKHAFLFEVPGALPQNQKEAVVRAILEEFIAPYLDSVRGRLR